MGDFKKRRRVTVNCPSSMFHGQSGVVVDKVLGGNISVLLDGEREPLAFGPATLQRKPVTTPAPDVVSHPPHYRDGTPPGIEVIDIIRAHEAAGGTWETLNAVKYILRHTLKDNPVQDIKKAIQYLSMWVERQEAA